MALWSIVSHKTCVDKNNYNTIKTLQFCQNECYTSFLAHALNTKLMNFFHHDKTNLAFEKLSSVP